MKGGMNKTEMISSLENVIIKDKVIVFDHDDIELFSILCDGLRDRKTDNIVVWQSIEESFNREYFTYVTQQKLDEILEVYHMYDFSDKVFVVSDPNQYGSLLNYLKTGILTKQEMVDSLLYNI